MFSDMNDPPRVAHHRKKWPNVKGYGGGGGVKLEMLSRFGLNLGMVLVELGRAYLPDEEKKAEKLHKGPFYMVRRALPLQIHKL